ncbi:MAG: rRNA maturation RNase YbeY [Parcubacteria group bacterium]|nr:MAG: rRNA maturation RNase YbeY [Parcubacteria group bacterium]
MIKTRRIQINKGSYRTNFGWLASLEKILRHKYKINKNISLALVSPARMQELNRVYRGYNKVTDVLSFYMESDLILGEVIICLSQAKKQARERRANFGSELKLLTVHGILHLLGYDHEKNAVEAGRQSRQEKMILSLLK